MTNNALHPYVCFHEILISKNSKQNCVSVQTWRVKILCFFVVNVFHVLVHVPFLTELFLAELALMLHSQVLRADVLVHLPFRTELFLTELALIGLESLVYDVDVFVEVSCPSKLLPTLTALIGLESPVYGVDVSLEGLHNSKLLHTLMTLVWLEFLMNLPDVLIKILF